MGNYYNHHELTGESSVRRNIKQSFDCFKKSQPDMA